MTTLASLAPSMPLLQPWPGPDPRLLPPATGSRGSGGGPQRQILESGLDLVGQAALRGGGAGGGAEVGGGEAGVGQQTPCASAAAAPKSSGSISWRSSLGGGGGVGRGRRHSKQWLITFCSLGCFPFPHSHSGGHHKQLPQFWMFWTHDRTNYSWSRGSNTLIFPL